MLKALLDATPELEASRLSYADGEVIVEEGTTNDRLLILAEGRVRLTKRDERLGKSVEVDALGPGSIIGLTSFWSRQPVYARIVANGPVACLAIEREAFDDLVRRRPDFVKSIHGLFVSNLADRYRQMIRSSVERERLARQLESERNQLREALEKLETMTDRLVNQEKLATLGQLLAGVAHEINNPASALLRNLESASERLEEALPASGAGDPAPLMLREGLACPFWSSAEKRRRMRDLGDRYPHLKRSQLRRLAQLTEPALEKALAALDDDDRWPRLLAVYELGVSLRATAIAAGRIEKLVRSLKSYGRQSGDAWEEADIAEGVRDTLVVLGNRLRNYEFELRLEELPRVSCNLGEMNQVWTNLLGNAMDATPPGGRIALSAAPGDGEVVVRIDDSGPGVPPDRRERIFEANYTTKNKSGSFGLGLGLSISKDIVLKHGGRIEVADSPLGGARFEVRLPVSG